MKHESDGQSDIIVTREVIEETGHKTDVVWTCENNELELALAMTDVEQSIHAPQVIIKTVLENKIVQIRGPRPSEEFKRLLQDAIEIKTENPGHRYDIV